MFNDECVLEDELDSTLESCVVHPSESPPQVDEEEQKQEGREQEQEENTEEESETDSYQSNTEWPEFDIPGTWGNYGLEANPWNDSDKPVVRFRKYEDITLTLEEDQGVLTERIIASCSSYLDKCPQTGKYVLCKCDLSRKNLTQVSILMFHHYLQYLNLSHNNITNLEPLSQLPFLMYLDVSHNTLTDLLNFKPPFNLTYVNFSYNYVDVIPNLSAFWSIVHLDLSHNQVFQISGLSKLRYLKYLDLSYNQIKFLQNLKNMSLTNLNLAHNQIDSFDGLESCLSTLHELMTINLSFNNLSTLRLFEGLTVLQKLKMTDNNISCLHELESLKTLRYLTEVDFRNNPMSLLTNYYQVCLNCINSIESLDGDYVPAEDKVLARAKITPPTMLCSAKNFADLFLLEQLNSLDMISAVLPIDKPPPPMIILVGPPGSGQKNFIQEFHANNKKRLRIIVSHTTRPKNSNEVEGESYYFITSEVFENMTRNGEFISISSILGHSYGLTYKELMQYVDEKVVLLFHVDLIGALNLRKRNCKPYLVLTVYLNSDAYHSELVKKYYYTYWLSRNYKALRIINDSGRINSSSSSHVSFEIEEILKDLVARLPIKEGPSLKKSSVKFIEPIPYKQDLVYSASSLLSDQRYEDSIESSDEMISFLIDAKKKENSSFNLTDGDVFHSISEVEFDFEPILSVVSDHVFDEDTDDVFGRDTKHSKPSQRIDNFIQSVLSTRDDYMSFHFANPGIFCETIFTDKKEEALQKLQGLLEILYSKKNTPWHKYSFEKDPLFEDMVSDKLSTLHADIHKEMFHIDVKNVMNDI